MAVRGSFQKRQKEAARREKRQLKLDRRQGKQPPGAAPSAESTDSESTETDHLESPDSAGETVSPAPLISKDE